MAKLLVFLFVLLLIARLLFRDKLRALGRFANRLVNATLVAIGIVYGIQLVLLFVNR